MARPLRIYGPGACCPVTIRGHECRDLFRAEAYGSVSTALGYLPAIWPRDPHLSRLTAQAQSCLANSNE